MAKITLTTIGSRYGSIDALNDNFSQIEQALENTFSLDGTSPNALEADLDMNGHQILNASTINASTLIIGGQTLEPGDAVASATVQVFEFTATAGQTSFSVSPLTPAASSVLMEVNGLSLPTSSLVTSGSTLSFPALSLNDEVVVKVFTREIGTYPAITNNEVATNAAIVSSKLAFTQVGTSAITRTVQSKLRDVVSVKDFGAVGNGIANDTAAINAALSAVYSTSQAVFFPAGVYLYDGGGSLGNGNVVFGEGRNATFIKSRLASPTSGYLICAYGYGSGIRGVAFYANVTQTAGSYVWLQGPETFIEDFYMTGDYNGILMTGNVSRIRHGRFQDGASGATRIRAEGGDNSQLIDDVLMGAQSPQVSFAGIRVRNSAALIISNTSVIEQGYGLLVDPNTNTQSATTSDGSVFSLYVNNCFFDNSANNGIRIGPSGTGSVVRCRFANVWASSSGSDGVYINNGGSGVVQGMHFESSHVVLNTGSGYTLGGTLSDISVIGGEICQNSYGMYVNNSVTNLKVTNATVGAGAGLNGNTNWGVVFGASAASSDYIVIANNVMQGNGAGAISASSVTGANISIYGNLGDVAGTWNPTITFATPGNLSVSYAAQSGAYKRMGNVVYVSFVISTSSFTWTTASGALKIAGLPFAASAQVGEGSIEYEGITKAGYTNYTLNVSVGNNYMSLRASGSAVAISTVAAADMPSGGTVTLRGSIAYFV